MVPRSFVSIVLIPSLNDPVSTHPLAIPAPTTPITWQWVVDAGNPMHEQAMTIIDPLRTTVNPYEGVNRLILDPIVMMTREPKHNSPSEIPNPPHKFTP